MKQIKLDSNSINRDLEKLKENKIKLSIIEIQYILKSMGYSLIFDFDEDEDMRVFTKKAKKTLKSKK